MCIDSHIRSSGSITPWERQYVNHCLTFYGESVVLIIGIDGGSISRCGPG